MNTLQPRRSSTPGQRKIVFGLGCFAGLLVPPFLLFYGYCWGWWGRQTVPLQYFFQCNCPVVSTEARYSESVDVIVHACRNGGIRLSPSGRLLYVRESKDDPASAYLLDLQTKEKLSFSLPDSAFYFLTDDLLYVFVYYVADEYILDRTTGVLYPIQRPTHFQPSIYSAGDLVPDLLLEALSKVDKIYVRDESFQPVVALSADFRTHPEHSFIFDALDFPGDDPDRVEQFLRKNHIPFQFVPAVRPAEAISPDGRFIARHDGIYVVKTNQKIVDGYKFSWYFRSYSGQYLSLQGWKYDSSGAIYSQFIGPCLLEPPGLDGPDCIWEVPQPVILLKLPEEYLSSMQTP